MSFSLTNSTRRKVPRVRFEKIKDHILGKEYELSFVLCGNTTSRNLNRSYRGKDKPTNVLAFPLTKHSGEIFINVSSLKGFSVPHLFIHGLLHLKGMAHGRKMEGAEKQFLHVASNRRWY